MEKKSCSKTSIGGQAVIEGVMMRGKSSQAIAVRSESGDILVQSNRLKKPGKITKIPIIRGVFAFFSSLISGTKALTASASVFGEEEVSNFDTWVSKKLKINAMDIAVFFGVVLGLALSLFLFFFLPQFITDLFSFLEKNSLLYCLIEGLVRIVIFVSYILLTSLLKDIRRTYMYHGAEHKTISCYESGLELTVENVRGCSRVHDRCGTTFMFLVMVISILVFAIVNSVLSMLGLNFDGFPGKMLRFLVKVLTLPIISGISYEILKLLAKTKSKFFIIFKAPGLLLQRVTTSEPTDDMIEVAIKSFVTVLEMDNDESIAEQQFDVFGSSETLLKKVNKVLDDGDNIDKCDGEWIVARVLNIKRSEISSKISVTKEDTVKALNYAYERAKNIPLAYVFGDADFYGYTFKVNSNVLIPRPETEELVEKAIKEITQENSVLDLCTGSGAIAITVNLKTNAKVTAVDISSSALEVASDNAISLKANVKFINSNMFEGVKDTFDFILSNPPYIKKADMLTLQKEVKKEPSLALDGGDDGLDFYRIIAANSFEHLNENGVVYLECGIEQAHDIAKMFEENGNYKNVSIIKDINGIDRIIRVERLWQVNYNLFLIGMIS